MIARSDVCSLKSVIVHDVMMIELKKRFFKLMVAEFEMNQASFVL